MTHISAPIFDFVGHPQLTASDAYIRSAIPGALLALTGPSVTADAGHLAVRGDLAHIKLAGRHFVSHYAAPMPHTVGKDGASLRQAARPDAEAIAMLPAGASFDALDIVGGWAWGQFGEDGPVGYVLVTELEASGA